MNSLLRFRSIDTDVLLRALAIAMVALNHAMPHGGDETGVAGGMTVLLMLSGYSFARFVMAEATPHDLRRGMWLFTLRIFVPSFIAVLFFFLVQREFNLTELLFIRNWFNPERISIFPVWYPQVIVQMGLMLLGFFALPGVATGFLRRPLLGSALVWLAGLLIRMILPRYVDTAPLLHHLPHLFLWNFALGWVVFFLLAQRSLATQFAAVVAVLVSAYLVWTPGRLQFWALAVAGLALIWSLRVRLPGALTHVFGLISQATFAIFLLHRFVYALYGKLLTPLPKGVLMWLLGLALCLGAWVVAAALSRAYHKLSRQQPAAGATASMSAATPAYA